MSSVLAFIVRKGGWFALAFAIVLAALHFAPALRGKRDAAIEAVDQATRARSVATAVERRQASFMATLNSSIGAANREASSLSTMTRDQLVQQRRALNTRLAQQKKVILKNSQFSWAVATGNANAIVASVRAEHVEVPLLEHLLRLIARRMDAFNRADEAFREKLTTLGNSRKAWQKRRADHLGNHARLSSEKAELDRRSATFGCRRLGLTCPDHAIKKHNDEVTAHKRDAVRLDRERDRLQEKQQSQSASAMAASSVERVNIIVADVRRAYESELRRTRAEAQTYAVNQSRSALRDHGWTAFGIVLGAMLSPVLWKLFSFIAIAPLVSRARPIRLSAPVQPLAASASHGALTVAIDRNTELLLRSQFQRGASDLKGKDVLVLSGRMLFTCIAAGLVNLQRLTSDRPEHVTVTADVDGFEVALLEVPVGGAVVLQPRALIGLRKRRADLLRVTRPWRLGSLASWLTFQFRFVVFHGPCALIVQGRRGVQVDYAGPAPGPMINSRLTLGFETNLEYGSARSASFMPYLRGEASLFMDRFSGDGCFIYEQRPSIAGRGTIWGRGLNGLKDAVLKAFGI